MTHDNKQPPGTGAAPSRTMARMVDRFTLAPMRDALFDTSALGPGDRWVVWLGYSFFALLLASSAVLDIRGGNLLEVAYPAPGDVTRVISWVAIAMTGVAYAAGWAFVFLAAGRLPAVCTPAIALLFAASAFLVRTWDTDANMQRLPVILAGAGLAAALAFLVRRWNGPGGAIVLFLALMLVLVGAHWLTGDAAIRTAQSHSTLGLIYYASLPIWLLSGLALLTLGTSLASGIVTRLRDSFAPATLQLVWTVVVFVHPFLLVLTFCPMTYFIFSEQTAYEILGLVLFLDVGFEAVLAVIGVALVLARRWNIRAGATLVVVRITLVVFVLGLLIADVSGFNLADPFAAAVERIDGVPPGLFFVFTLMLSVLGFFVPFANADGARMPRRARVPLVIGLSLLVVAALIFFLNARDIADGSNLATDVALSIPFLAGAVLLGFPYLAYVALRGRDALIGPPDAWPEAPPVRVPRLSRRMLLVIVLALPLVVTACGCMAASVAVSAARLQ